MTTLPSLGSYREVVLPQGTIRYREVGSGVPIVFVHGILVNSTLWREVAPALADTYRCVLPDLPLGGHSLPMDRDADLSPGGVAWLLADFLDALDLRDVILVGNDTGGAICQIVIARHPARLAGLVLTNCDAYEAFFPPLLTPFQYGARAFGTRFVDLVAGALRARFAQRALLWSVSLRRPDAATLDAYFGPLLGDAGIRRDLAHFLAAISNRYTLEAAAAFPQFRHPVLIVWGRNDLFFPARLARRLQRDFPDATLDFVPRSRAFVPEDQPQLLAERIAAFLSMHAPSTAATASQPI